MNFIFEQIRTGGDRNFAYLIGDRTAGEAAVVDPSFAPEIVIERATLQSLRVKYIINTHGHSDHTNGNAALRKSTGAPVAAYRHATPPPDLPVDDNADLKVGSIALKFFHMPGHTDDHLVAYLPAERIAITGDLLFVGKIGGTSSDGDARTEWNSLQRLLGELPGEATIWPGHDFGCRPSSTLALEKQCNPFLQCKNLREFLRLKAEWPEFKARNGLK